LTQRQAAVRSAVTQRWHVTVTRHGTAASSRPAPRQMQQVAVLPPSDRPCSMKRTIRRRTVNRRPSDCTLATVTDGHRKAADTLSTNRRRKPAAGHRCRCADDITVQYQLQTSHRILPCTAAGKLAPDVGHLFHYVALASSGMGHWGTCPLEFAECTQILQT